MESRDRVAESGIDLVQRTTHVAIQKLDGSLFRVRFDRLTPREKDYMRAMADGRLTTGVASLRIICSCRNVRMSSRYSYPRYSRNERVYPAKYLAFVGQVNVVISARYSNELRVRKVLLKQGDRSLPSLCSETTVTASRVGALLRVLHVHRSWDRPDPGIYFPKCRHTHVGHLSADRAFSF